MKAFLTPRPSLLARIAATCAALALAATLTACGGSGGKSDGGTNTGSNTNTGQTGGNTTASGIGPITLSGVAAMGAPLLNATVNVVDAKGVLRGTGTTNKSDGSYTLGLGDSDIPLPLLIEATGVDMTGTPINLHSVVQSVPSGATRITANIHPITDAIVAMLLGGDPTTQFKNAAANASTWTYLGNTTALTSASDLIKTIVKANITDAKVANSTTLDFFQDPNFRANKAGLDGVLESLNVQVSQDRSGNAQVELTNRLKAPGSVEVTIKLSDVTKQLAAGTTGKLSLAINSTAKVTTSVATLINNLATLDNLIATLNQSMAEHADSSVISALPVFSSSYTYHDGQDLGSLASTLATFGAAGAQLSRVQFTGCTDYPLPTSGCSKPAMSALLTDASGQVVGVFDNVLTYSTTAGWKLRGNGQSTKWSVTPSVWMEWTPYGTASTTPETGVFVQANPDSSSIVSRLDRPSLLSMSLSNCNLPTSWCLSVSSIAEGDLVKDHMLKLNFGTTDATKGAVYQFASKSILNPDGNLSARLLPADVPSGSTSAQFPLPDDVSTSTPLTCGDIYAGLHVTWANWAANNPSMTMVSLRSMANVTGSDPVIQDVSVLPLSTMAADVPALVSPPSSPSNCQLWMVAKDKWGRLFMSKIVTPV